MRDLEMLGNVIMKERGKKGLTQRDLAKKSDVSECTITLLEKARVERPRADTLCKLAKALEINEDTLLQYI